MYCGLELEFDEKQSQFIKPTLRLAESHINGFNLIYLGNLRNWNEKQISEVSKMTRLTKNVLDKIFQSGKPLPLARTETLKETEIVSQRLKEIGIETVIIEDNRFEIEKNARRLRRLEIKDDKLILILFNNDEVCELQRDDLALIVVGGLFEKTLESTEKHKKKGDNKVLETSEISSDEMIVDLFSKGDSIGYRLFQKGFDFSTLGKDKKLLANENLKILVEKLNHFAPDTKLDDDYLRVRDCLSGVWVAEEQSDSKGMKRQSFGSYQRLTETKTSNLQQFTKYSRLQRFLL
jgi:hypothetical protein